MSGKTENVRVNVYINGAEAGKNLKGIRAESRKLRNELNQLTPGTEKFKQKAGELKSVNKRLKTITDDVNGVGGAFGKIKQEIKAFGVVAIGVLGAGVLIEGINNMIDRNAKLSDSFADVMKTTGLTKQEVEEISKSFKSFNTRSSRKELLGLARIAGKLGIEGKENVLGFVKATDQLNVALSEDLGGSAEEAIRQVGKLINLFAIDSAYSMEESLLKVGSTINALGAASTANEAYLVNFTKRLGGVAATANIAITDVLGMAATLDQLGQTAEISTTVLTQLIVKMGKDIPRFAKLAGMEVSEFSAVLQEDANAALIAVIENMENSTGGAEGMAKALDQLGLDGVRSAGVVAALSGNIELLKDQQRLSNIEFEKGTSLTDEYNIKNETLAAKLGRVQKKMAALFINSSVAKGIENIVGWMDKLIKVKVSETLEKERASLVGIEAQLKNTNLKHADRVKLIKELQNKYPDYLVNINAETATNKELSLAIKSVNDQLINKIILQKKDEQIASHNEIVSEKKMEIMEQEDLLMNKISTLKKKGYKINLIEGTTLQQLLDVNKQLLEQDKNKFKNQGILFNHQVQFSHGLRVLVEKTKTLHGLEKNGNILLNQKNELIERLGLNTEETTTKVVKAGKEVVETEKTTTELTTAEITERAKAEKKLTDFKKAQIKEFQLDQLTSYEREVVEIQDKYQTMIDLAREFGFEKKAAELEGMMLAQTTLLAVDDFVNNGSDGEQDYSKFMDEFGEGGEEEADAAKEIEIELLKQNKIAEFDLIEEFRQSDFDSFEAFLAKKETADDKHLRNKKAKLRLYQQEANAIFGAMYAVNDAMMSDELKQAGDDEMKKERILKKYAKKRQAIAFTETLVQGALGIVQTGANLGYPLAIPFQIAQGIQTIAQAAIISNQKFAKGGYTGFGLGFSDETGQDVAGTVHANEYVIPYDLLSGDPWVMDATRVIEAKRTGQQGYADGGNVDATGSTSTNFTESNTAISDPLLIATLERLMVKMDEPSIAIADDRFARDMKDKQNLDDIVTSNSIV